MEAEIAILARPGPPPTVFRGRGCHDWLLPREPVLLEKSRGALPASKALIAVVALFVPLASPISLGCSRALLIFFFFIFVLDSLDPFEWVILTRALNIFTRVFFELFGVWGLPHWG